MGIILLALLIYVVAISFLKLVDRKIQGKHTVLKKIGALLLIGLCLFLLFSLYGDSISTMFGEKLKSFTKTKQLFLFKLIGLLVLLFVFLLIVIRGLHIRTIKVEKREYKRANVISSDSNVVFDVEIVPVENTPTIFNTQRVTNKLLFLFASEGGIIND